MIVFQDEPIPLSLSDREQICNRLTFQAIQPDITQFANFVYSCFCAIGPYSRRRERVNPERRNYIKIDIDHGFGDDYVFPMSRTECFDGPTDYFDTPRLDYCEYAKLNSMLGKIKILQASGVNPQTRAQCVAVRASADTRELFYNCPEGYVIWLENAKDEI